MLVQIRQKGLVARAKTSKVAAIKLFCYECMGGSVSDAKKCESKECFLWPHGPAGRAARRKERLANPDPERQAINGVEEQR
jgi:hypothetical protein